MDRLIQVFVGQHLGMANNVITKDKMNEYKNVLNLWKCDYDTCTKHKKRKK